MALAGGVGHRVLAEAIGRIRVRAAREELRNHRRIAAVGRRHERRDAVRRGDVHVGARGEHRLRGREVVLLERDEERRLAEAIARLGRSAGGQRVLDRGRVGIARGGEKLHVHRYVILGACRAKRGGGKRRDGEASQRSERHEFLRRCVAQGAFARPRE
jgi:hypothetical protein